MRSKVLAIYTLVIEKLNRTEQTQADWQRTVSVSSVGVGPKIKNLTKGKNDEKRNKIDTRLFNQR